MNSSENSKFFDFTSLIDNFSFLIERSSFNINNMYMFKRSNELWNLNLVSFFLLNNYEKFSKGYRTWFYLTQPYVFFSNDSSVTFKLAEKKIKSVNKLILDLI